VPLTRLIPPLARTLFADLRKRVRMPCVLPNKRRGILAWIRRGGRVCVLGLDKTYHGFPTCPEDWLDGEHLPKSFTAKAIQQAFTWWDQQHDALAATKAVFPAFKLKRGKAKRRTKAKAIMHSRLPA